MEFRQASERAHWDMPEAAYISVLGQDGDGVVQTGDERIGHSPPPAPNSLTRIVYVPGGNGVATVAVPRSSTSNACNQSLLSPLVPALSPGHCLM